MLWPEALLASQAWAAPECRYLPRLM